MCIGIAVSEERKKQIIKSLTKKGFVKVYKVARKRGNGFGSPTWNDTIYQRNTIQNSSYVCDKESNSGWHGFLNYEGARGYKDKTDGIFCEEVILICYVKPEWIIEIGEICFGITDQLTVRTSKIFFPDFPNRRASIKEFRKALKEMDDE